MTTLILMNLATLVTLIYYLPIYAIHPAAPAVLVATDRPSIPSSATGPLRLLKRLARILNERWPWRWLRLVVTRSAHSPRPPG
jgi:hypothetical protein